MTFESAEMLLSRRKPVLKCEHFPFFILDDFAPSELFQKLEAEFPSYEEMSGSHQRGKVFINNRDLVGQEDAFFESRRLGAQSSIFSDRRSSWRISIGCCGRV